MLGCIVLYHRFRKLSETICYENFAKNKKNTSPVKNKDMQSVIENTLEVYIATIGIPIVYHPAKTPE